MCTSSAVLKCSVCGATFEGEKDLEKHSMITHSFVEEESYLLKKAGKGKKARRRSRGPYRKAHAA